MIDSPALNEASVEDFLVNMYLAAATCLLCVLSALEHSSVQCPASICHVVRKHRKLQVHSDITPRCVHSHF